MRAIAATRAFALVLASSTCLGGGASAAVEKASSRLLRHSARHGDAHSNSESGWLGRGEAHGMYGLEAERSAEYVLRDLQANEIEESLGATDVNATATNTTEEDESIVDKLREGADKVKDEVTSVLNTNPSNWTTGQKVGIGIGIAVAFLILVCLLCCCCKKCRGRQTPVKYRLQKPYVTRGDCAAVDDTNNLPLGVRLHGAQKLRNAGLTGKSVRVAVIDSGIDKDHPNFNGSVKKQKWYRAGTPLSQDDHGTHVAGTIHFMAPDAELYDYRVFGESGDLDGDDAVAESIRQACADGCHVINMSLRVSYPIVPTVRSAVKFAYSKGVHMVCAAGNSGDGDPLTNELYAYPARWSETISVAAVKKAGDLPVAYFSESNPQVDYAGIGVDVTSLKPGGGFQAMQGTSMAAPHVTGLIAALLTKGGYAGDKVLRRELTAKYAIDIGAEGPDNSTGVGFLTYLSKNELDGFWKGAEFQALTPGFRAHIG